MTDKKYTRGKDNLTGFVLILIAIAVGVAGFYFISLIVLPFLSTAFHELSVLADQMSKLPFVVAGLVALILGVIIYLLFRKKD